MITKPYLIFLGNTADPADAKTGFGLRDWAREDCIGQWRLTAETVDLGLPDRLPKEAWAAGARSLVIGIAPDGGQIAGHWVPHLVEALEAGLDLVSGLHSRLGEIDAVAAAARRTGRRLHDVRHSGRSFPVASGRKRSGKRLLTVGTDCALGKKYTALALTRALREAGIAADFRATGQTGILIVGSGVAVDTVVADFIAGAAETLSPDAPDDHWDVIEGQGAIFHPAYAAVTLGLLHGSQPDALILCHDAAREEISCFPSFPIRDLGETMEVYLSLARVTNPSARFVGISLNSSSLDERSAGVAADELSRRHGLPCFDPLRFGLEAVVERIACL